MDAQRKLLEELMNPIMGTERTYKDPQMCAHMLACGYCPFDLFTNTKCDIGFCDKKVHDEKLVKQYQESPDRYKLGHEQAFHSFALRLVQDMDRIIRRQKDKVQQEEPSHNLNREPEPTNDEKEERIAMIEGQVKQYTQQLQDAGEQGFVDRAIDLLTTVELLKTNIEAIRTNANSRRLVVCDICSATLVYNDSTQRMQDHITGKQHLGYKKLREWIKEWDTRTREERGSRGSTDYYGNDRAGGERDLRGGGDRDHRWGGRRDDAPPPQRWDDRDRDRRGGSGGYDGRDSGRRYRR
ncbi:hypothetical protein BJ741DRAFT_652413 [Chytriomyces cf. hyalinus JEL632]|nr:hypothetical protein BJ741DRAFT_652413 [Chytriomyces cf. hyalinus JEL632]